MSKKILYREVNGNHFGFVALLTVFGALVALGAWAFFSVEHTGHYVTGMDNQIVWGIPHVFAITLIVAASGALNIGSIGTVFGKKAYQPLGRLSAVLAIALLIGGLAILVLDLGRPDRLIIAMTYYNFKSIFAWNIILYNGFIAIVGFYIWTMMDRRMKGFYKPAGTFAFIWRLILTLGTGSIFGFLVARQYYDAAIMGPLFIVMSFAMGLAIFNLVLLASYSMTGRELGNVIINKLRYLLAVFIGGVVLLELARHLTQLYATEHHGIEAFILMGDNIYSQLFWYGFVLVGTVLPLFLIFCTKLKNSRLAFMGASVMVIAGYVAQIYVILIGGQAYPLQLFPNATVESVYFDGTVNEYLPSLHEILLGVGGIGIVLLVVAIAVSVLRVLPESLSDKSVDPHHNK